MNNKLHFLVFVASLVSGCAGMKVVDPNKPNNKGTLQLDYSEDGLKLVGTHTCAMVGANGRRVYATGKTEEEARKEAIAKCQDQMVVSFCKSSKMSCEKN
jgi:hypothetical protein